MPFKSEAQRKYLYANAPEIAKKFEKLTIKENLPERVKQKNNRKKAMKKMSEEG